MRIKLYKAWLYTQYYWYVFCWHLCHFGKQYSGMVPSSFTEWMEQDYWADI